MRDRRFRKTKVRGSETETATPKKWGLEAKLAATIVGTSLAVVAFYALQIATPAGLMAGISISGGLSYAYIKPSKGHKIALAGSILIVFIVLALSMVLMITFLYPLEEVKIRNLRQSYPEHHAPTPEYGTSSHGNP
jgi:hypothetical protein